MLTLNLIIINVYLQSVPAQLNRLKRLRIRAIYTLKYNNNNNNNNSKAICITTANCQYHNWSEFCGPSVYAETLQGSDACVSSHSSPASGPAAGGGACGLGWGSPRRRLGPSSPGGRAGDIAWHDLASPQVKSDLLISPTISTDLCSAVLNTWESVRSPGITRHCPI